MRACSSLMFDIFLAGVICETGNWAFIVGLYCITITWQRIFKTLVQNMVKDVLPHGCQFVFAIFGFFSTLFAFFHFWKFSAFFDQLNFLCRFGRFKVDIGRFLGTGRFLDTGSNKRQIFVGNSAREIIIICCCFKVCSFRLLFSKTNSFEKLINEVWVSSSFVTNMHILSLKRACFKGVVVYLFCI